MYAIQVMKYANLPIRPYTVGNRTLACLLYPNGGIMMHKGVRYIKRLQPKDNLDRKSSFLDFEIHLQGCKHTVLSDDNEFNAIEPLLLSELLPSGSLNHVYQPCSFLKENSTQNIIPFFKLFVFPDLH